MADPKALVHEVLVAPLPVLLSQTALAVAEAQVALDESAMAAQERLDLLAAEIIRAVPDEADRQGLARFQLEAPWYHFSEVEVDIQMSLSIEVREEQRGGKRVLHPRLSAVPHNARSQNQTDFDARGTSRLRARLSAIPAPVRPA